MEPTGYDVPLVLPSRKLWVSACAIFHLQTKMIQFLGPISLQEVFHQFNAVAFKQSLKLCTGNVLRAFLTTRSCNARVLEILEESFGRKFFVSRILFLLVEWQDR